MRTLYIHIGQGKTGTSYLQTAMALSASALADHDIGYPLTKKIRKKLAANLNAGGNGLGLCDAIDDQSKLKSLKFPARGHVLLSYEGLISRLMFEGSDTLLDDLCDKHGFDAVSILVFCRNPVAHAVSSYRQLVKRSGMAKTLNRYCQNYNSPRQLARFLKKYHGRKNISIRILNYTQCRDSLLTELAAWLDVPESLFIEPPQGTINRSLTLAELMFQWELNKHLGDEVELFASPLFETLPKIKPEKIYPGLQAQMDMVERLQPFMDQVNGYMDDEKHHYQEDITRPKGQLQMREKYEFTGPQLAALAKLYAETLKKQT